jgi:hypothetical protein
MMLTGSPRSAIGWAACDRLNFKMVYQKNNEAASAKFAWKKFKKLAKKRNFISSLSF